MVCRSVFGWWHLIGWVLCQGALTTKESENGSTTRTDADGASGTSIVMVGTHQAGVGGQLT